MSNTTRDNSPPLGACKWYVSVQQPECGKKAVARVLVKGRSAQATVPLCGQHKAMHDERAASIRNKNKAAG